MRYILIGYPDLFLAGALASLSTQNAGITVSLSVQNAGITVSDNEDFKQVQKRDSNNKIHMRFLLS